MTVRPLILLVDDSENDRLLMRRALTHAEIENPVQEVGNGEEAIAYLAGEDCYGDRDKYPFPGLMLLDLKMAKKNGFDVLSWVRAHPSLKGLTVIILSASMRTEDVKRAFELGAHSFLVKPTTFDVLTGMMRAMRDWLRYDHFPPLNSSVQS